MIPYNCDVILANNLNIYIIFAKSLITPTLGIQQVGEIFSSQISLFYVLCQSGRQFRLILNKLKLMKTVRTFLFLPFIEIQSQTAKKVFSYGKLVTYKDRVPYFHQ